METALDVTYRGTVYPWHCDHMGHMNVMWYVGKFDEATWHLFSSIGFTPEHLRESSAAWSRWTSGSPTAVRCGRGTCWWCAPRSWRRVARCSASATYGGRRHR